MTTTTDELQNALLTAVTQGRVDEARAFIDQGADCLRLFRHQGDEMSLLHMACGPAVYRSPEEKADMLKLLLDHGASANINDYAHHAANEETPLAMACREVHPKEPERDAPVLKALLDAGADPNLNRWTGWKNDGTALHTRAIESEALVKLLLEHGADPNIPMGPKVQTPLHDLFHRLDGGRGVPEGVHRLLIEAGADLDRKDGWGSTPLGLVKHQSKDLAERWKGYAIEGQRKQLQAVADEPRPAPPNLANAYRNLQSQGQDREQGRGRTRL